MKDLEGSNGDKSKDTADQDGVKIMRSLEEAMCQCKFGRFHWRVLAAALAACFANNIVTANTSYLLPAAECDFGMTINQKGLLNAAPFVGMLSVGFFSAFLTDAFGRRRFLVWGYFGIFLSCLLEGSSQTFSMLLIGKFLEGCCLSLGFGANISIVSEFSHKNIRDMVMMFVMSFKCLSAVVIVLITWVMLTQHWQLALAKGIFELHTWSIYLYVCGIWGLLASIQYYFLPESPKFLLTHGDTNGALSVVKCMYSENTGRPADTFPIRSLTEGNEPRVTETEKPTFKKQLLEGLLETRALVRKPLLFYLLTFTTISFMVMFAYNTLRLWFPQISTILETFKKERGRTEMFCVMIDDYMQNISHSNKSSVNVTEQNTCVPRLPGTETYLNGIVMGVICLLSHGLSGLFLKKIGCRILISVFLIASSASAIGLHWCRSTIEVTILMSLIVGLTQASVSLLGTAIVRVFPTTVRTTALALMMITGRIGSMAGNFIFPLMLQNGCMIPFLTVAVMCLSSALSVFLLPNTKKQNQTTGES